MPFNLLAIAVALNIFLGGWPGGINLFFGELKINKTGFFTIALVLGGLAFLNTWDILPGAALIVLSYASGPVREAGWDWEDRRRFAAGHPGCSHGLPDVSSIFCWL